MRFVATAAATAYWYTKHSVKTIVELHKLKLRL